MNLNGKKLLLLGFVLILLVAIPLTLFLLQKQQETRSRAQKSTNLSFSPSSSQSSPLQKAVGDTFSLDVMVNPGQNIVSFVKLEVQYDADKIATDSSNAFQPNSAAFPTILEGPIYSPGKIQVTLSVGSDPTKAIQSITKAATFNFKAIGPTAAGTPTLITYGAQTQVLSIGSTDQASEDVLSSATPATVVITGSGSGGTPTPTPETGTTPVPTSTGTPPPPVTQVPAAQPTVAANQPPICQSLNVSPSNSGSAPYAVTLATSGYDPDGSVNKVTFNFGDGQVSDITQGGGIGTASISAQTVHTYQGGGTFQASAIYTDDRGAVSAQGACTQTITVAAPIASTQTGGSNGVVAQPTVTPAPTALPSTGPGSKFIGIGAVVTILTLIGGMLFFAL